MSAKRCKCHFPDGMEIRPDGVHRLDPCVYVEKQLLRNVTVSVCQCAVCGNVTMLWRRQENTEVLQYEELAEQPDE